MDKNVKKIKIVGVISSPRVNGNTTFLVRKVLKGAEKEGASIKEIFLIKNKIEFCTGCFKCMSEGICPINDDFEKIKMELSTADGIIWGSPTYGGEINAIIKNFLERLGLFENFTSSLRADKYMIGISTAGQKKPAIKTAKSLVSRFSGGIVKRGYNSGFIGAGINVSKIEDNTNLLIKADRLGKKFYNDIKNKKRYPLQNIFNKIINSILIKPNFINIILKNKNGFMKAVYNNLLERGLI